MPWELEDFNCKFTNWTFGVWWGRFAKRGLYHIGIEIGPLQWMFTRREEDRER